MARRSKPSKTRSCVGPAVLTRVLRHWLAEELRHLKPAVS